MFNDEDYETFLRYYFELCIKKKRPSGFVEKQFTTQGPLVVDIDFNYAIDCTTRLFTHVHIEGIIEAYLKAITKVYKFEADSEFTIYYMQRTHPTVDIKGNRAKDGMHFMFTLHVTAQESLYIRDCVLEEIRDICADLPLTNSIDAVVDRGIAAKTIAWPLYGSQKAGNTPYEVDRIYHAYWDAESSCFLYNEDPVQNYTVDSVADIKRVSVRNMEIPFFVYSEEYSAHLSEQESIAPHTAAGTNALAVTRVNNVESAFECMANSQIVNLIYSTETLNAYIEALLQRWDDARKYTLCDIYKYTMALPESYYGPGSFVKWLNVGWALKVSNEQLFVVWVAFSAKSESFRFEDIPDMLERWNMAKTTGLSAGSIKYWLREEDPTSFYKIRDASVDHRIMKLIHSGGSTDPAGDVDQATLLYELYGDFYVCVSIKHNVWFAYEGHRWILDEEGTLLRRRITEIHEKFILYELKLKMQQAAIGMNLDAMQDPKAKNPEYEKLQKTIDIVEKAAKSLNNTSKRKNIMVECKELFYDREFFEQLDTKPMLFCFQNGVVDFQTKTFRKGKPEDYLSISCGHSYNPKLLDEHTNGETLHNIRRFFEDIYPIEDTREYVLDHLASVLIGEACQTFHMYWGGGSNGKTKVLEFMTMAMGEYGHTIPISMICDERAKVGSVSPEIIELRGIRWGTIFEPSQKAVVEEGPFKQITGSDPVTGRGLYDKKTTTFKPQVTVVVCSNYDLQFRTTDHGTWRRNRKIPHISTFSEEPPKGNNPYQFQADLGISSKFPFWVETLLAMLVQRAFETGGKVRMRETIENATNKMRQGQDIVAEFIHTRISSCLPGESQFGLTKPQLTAEYTNWRKENYSVSTYKVDITNLHDAITKQFGEFQQDTASWHGIKLNHIQMMEINDFVSSDGAVSS